MRMAPKRILRPEPGRERERERERERKKKTQARQATVSLIYSASPQLLDLLLRQRAWSYELWAEEDEEEAELEELVEEPQEPDDPDYDGRSGDEDEDFSELPADGDEEGESWLRSLEALEALILEQALRRPDRVDIQLEVLPQGRVAFWSPLGARWLRMSAEDPVGSWCKEALRSRIQALSVIAGLLIEKNESYFLGEAPQPMRLSRDEAIRRLQEHLEVGSKSRVSRLLNTAQIRLPDGTVWPLEEFFKPPEDLQTAYALFFTLAVYYEEERENPYSDRALSSLETISTKRSNVQKVRRKWLPNSRERARLYREGKDLPDLLKEKVGDGPEKLSKLLAILEGARKWAQKYKNPRAQLAQKRLEEWLEAIRPGGEAERECDRQR